MRRPTFLLLALLAATTVTGCGGGTALPEPAKLARMGPPPDTSPDMAKVAKANKIK